MLPATQGADVTDVTDIRAMVECAAKMAWDGKRLRRLDVVIDEETDGYRIRARCWCWSAMSALIDAPPGGASEWAGRRWVKRLDAALDSMGCYCVRKPGTGGEA